MTDFMAFAVHGRSWLVPTKVLLHGESLRVGVLPALLPLAMGKDQWILSSEYQNVHQLAQIMSGMSNQCGRLMSTASHKSAFEPRLKDENLQVSSPNMTLVSGLLCRIVEMKLIQPIFGLAA
jgi:hypothetical protein